MTQCRRRHSGFDHFVIDSDFGLRISSFLLPTFTAGDREIWRRRLLLPAEIGGRGITSGMRTLRWVPFTFLAGLHGFAIFAPYAALVLTVYHVIRASRRRRLAVAR
jgi:hypothetical protein